jgi:hypothetical protein
VINDIRDQYKKTFLGVQVLCVGVTLWTFRMTHWWGPPAVIFAVMQASAVLGAAWSARIRRRTRQVT